ncbi:MAG: rRNA maturation RNase YbeY [Clostridia bacterium]|jgi:probable rRNA maturation factor|nr:rRNA maturation RNase YbeY [Clostridia bacterium]
MRNLAEIVFEGIEEKEEYKKIIDKVYERCFKEERLYDYEIYISIIITNEEYIKRVNSEYRNIDEVTDVLSFPMFEPSEIDEVKKRKEALGDVIICIPRVENQAKEYGHSFEREFAYMLVHGFYHLMGYDHMNEEDKEKMRAKEENILRNIGFERVEN